MKHGIHGREEWKRRRKEFEPVYELVKENTCENIYKMVVNILLI